MATTGVFRERTCSIFYGRATRELWCSPALTFSASVRGCRCAVREPTAVARAFRAIGNPLSRGVELIVSSAGSIGTRTDIQQANGFLLAQESAAARDGGD
jgi:hypothetical protein